MSLIFQSIAIVIGIYSLLIFISIIFSWFRGFVSGAPVTIINKITDPYLNWWRRYLNLRVGVIDFSVIVAIMFLYLLQNIFFMLAIPESLTLGNVLNILLYSIWSVIQFIVIFCLIVIILRAIAFFTNRNIYSPFWRIIDSISGPILYRFNRLFFGKRIGNYMQGLILSVLLLIAVLIGGRFIVRILAGFLSGL
ncbi:MAG: YggT family protein [Treponema sp.]|nr:YggT family protein [Treponema sp.]